MSQLVTGYLPSVILHFLSSYVPSIMKLFSTMQGYVCVSGIERSACNKMLRFTIWTVFFANVLAGSVLDQVEIFLKPEEIPSKLAVVVPAQVASALVLFIEQPQYSTRQAYFLRCCLRKLSQITSGTYVLSFLCLIWHWHLVSNGYDTLALI